MGFYMILYFILLLKCTHHHEFHWILREMDVVLSYYAMKCLQQRSCRCVCQHVGRPRRSSEINLSASTFYMFFIWRCLDLAYIYFSFQQEFSLTMNSVRPFVFMFYLQGSIAPLTEEISWYGSGQSNVGKSQRRGEACRRQDGPTDDEPTWRRMGLAGRRCMFHCNHLHPCCNQVILRVCVCVCVWVAKEQRFSWNVSI